MIQLMAAINLTPDSFYEPSRVDSSKALSRISEFVMSGVSIIDLGAVSTRPGAKPVSVKKEWHRLCPVLSALARDIRLSKYGVDRDFRISVDTTSAEIVRRTYDTIGPFIVNDISAGEDDSEMLQVVAGLGLTYIAMHKRGTPVNMDLMTDYPGGVMRELLDYFRVFARHAGSLGIKDWIIDPGLGFAKTDAQNWEILRKLNQLASFDKPVLVAAADKRFTHKVPVQVNRWFVGNSSAGARLEYGLPEDMQNCAVSGTDVANVLAISKGANILRVHDIPIF